MTSPTADIRPDANRVVVTRQTEGEIRLRYSPIEPQYPEQPTTGEKR